MFGPLVRLSGVHKRYRLGEVEVTALRDAQLSIEAGELVVVLGPSGSGKTTLLNILGGLDRPTSGQVSVAGRELGSMADTALTAYRRDVIGFVFQFFNLVPTLTARENVELVAGLVSRPLPPRRALAAVGLSERENHFPAALSGGEQQRVAIARALVKRPSLMLADEPTGSLDRETSVRVLKVMRQTMEELGYTTVLVTHNQEIARMADRVVRLQSGMVAAVTRNVSPVPPEELGW